MTVFIEAKHASAQAEALSMKQQELIPHLFRTEFGKITSVLTGAFGLEHVEVAEDITSEVFLSALETWPYKGLPENPRAWIYQVARNKARNYLSRNKIFADKVAREIKARAAGAQEFDVDLTDTNITDSQLRMLFAVCHPCLPAEAQIGLSLRLLCGFGIEEIATAFLTNKETINKRLYRAKEKLRTEQVMPELPDAAGIRDRVDNVLTTLYLLFSEGYYSESRDEVLREDLCLEAMRLTYLLLENPRTNRPDVNALMALMCFHSSRFHARKNDKGEMILYEDQDTSLWNQELITRGVYFLHQAAQGNNLSTYHLEASIAYWHTVKEDTAGKWERILQLYNKLLMVRYSPIAALNRTYALSKVKGSAPAIVEAEKLRLTENPFYYTLLGELYKGTDPHKATENFQRALSLARTNTDRQALRQKLEKL